MILCVDDLLSVNIYRNTQDSHSHIRTYHNTQDSHNRDNHDTQDNHDHDSLVLYHSIVVSVSLIQSMPIPVTQYAVTRISKAIVLLMFPAVLCHGRIADIFSTAASQIFMTAALARWLDTCVQNSDCAMVFFVILH